MAWSKEPSHATVYCLTGRTFFSFRSTGKSLIYSVSSLYPVFTIDKDKVRPCHPALFLLIWQPSCTRSICTCRSAVFRTRVGKKSHFTSLCVAGTGIAYIIQYKYRAGANSNERQKKVLSSELVLCLYCWLCITKDRYFVFSSDL